jgi:hypothetical protein
VLSGVLSSSGASPTGPLTLTEGASVVASQSVPGPGAFTFSVSTLPVGTHVLMVSYGGDVNNTAATSNVVTVVVQQGSTAAALSSSKNPQVAGQAVTFTAAVTSPSPAITGTMTFYDGSAVIGSVPVASGGTAVLSTSSLAFGLHSVTAVYSGDAAHSGSTSPALSQRIVDAISIGLSSSANPAVTGTALTFTVKLSGNASAEPSGVISFFDGSSLLGTATLDATGTATFGTSTLAIGSHTITGSFAGDTNYASSVSTPLIETITSANTSIALAGSANPASYGSPLTLQAVVTSNGGIATGSIAFTDGGAALGTAVLDATGTAKLVTSALLPGPHTIVANYAGDGKASPSVSTPLVIVVKQATTVSVSSSANPADTLSPITFTAIVANAGKDVPTGTIVFTDGGTTLGTVALDPTGTATIALAALPAGTHAVIASYSGNDTNFAAVSAMLSEAVNKRVTTTALTATVDPTNSQQVTLIAILRWTGATSPTGNVVFTNGTATVGTAAVDAAGVATLIINNTLQSQNLVATYSGDASYAGSASPLTAIAPQQQPQFTLTLDPPTMTLVSKQHSTATLTIASPGSFTDTLEYGCLGLPQAATCTFSQTTGVLKAGSSVQVQLTVDTGNPLGAGAQASLRDRQTPRGGATPLLLECFLPAMLLAGLGMRRLRRMGLSALLTLLVAVGMIVSTTGCGGLNVNGTPAGSYTFQVTARGQNTNITESQTMTLTVTP